jgi:NADH-quinone oxidoreductase subunit M
MLSTLLICLPLAGAVAVGLLPLSRDLTSGLAFLIALSEVGLWIGGVFDFDFDTEQLQYAASWEWFEAIGASYSVGMYGFSFWLVGLTAVVGAGAVAYAGWVGRERPRLYYSLVLLLIGSVVGVFVSQDLLQFYVFFEAMLIPLYVLVGVWGGPDRQRATVTFVLYTMAGSLLMLAAVVAYGISVGTFDLAPGAGGSDNDWIFLGFVVAFAVKAPLLPLHGWLRAAYTQAPPEIAALLSGVVSKTAVYGLIWIVLLHFRVSAQDPGTGEVTIGGPVIDFQTLLLVLGAATLVYGSLLAFRQPDLRGVIAYSSMAQMGLITMGIFALDPALLGLSGTILQSLAHGLVSATMFFLAGMVERSCGTGEVVRLGGMAKGRPALATVVMVTGMIMLAVPGSATFAGEFTILSGAFFEGWGYAAVGAGAIVLAALYGLRLISAVLHEARGPAVPEEAPDLDSNQLWLVVPLVACLLALSAWPAGITGNSFPGDEPAVEASE